VSAVSTASAGSAVNAVSAVSKCSEYSECSECREYGALAVPKAVGSSRQQQPIAAANSSSRLHSEIRNVHKITETVLITSQQLH
jgi:hypothetical protein